MNVAQGRRDWGIERKKMSGQKDGGGGGWGFSEHALCSEDASSVVQFNLLDQNKRCSLWKHWAWGHPISEWLAFDLSQALARTWLDLFLPYVQMCMHACIMLYRAACGANLLYLTVGNIALF